MSNVEYRISIDELIAILKRSHATAKSNLEKKRLKR